MRFFCIGPDNPGGNSLPHQPTCYQYAFTSTKYVIHQHNLGKIVENAHLAFTLPFPTPHFSMLGDYMQKWWWCCPNQHCNRGAGKYIRQFMLWCGNIFRQDCL